MTQRLKTFDAPLNSLIESTMSPKHENNERIKSWGTLFGSQRYGVKRHVEAPR